jgi:hypothetical protein
MENISSSLLTLSRSDQLELRAELVKIADNANDDKFAKFVRALPDMIGVENSD